MKPCQLVKKGQRSHPFFYKLGRLFPGKSLITDVITGVEQFSDRVAILQVLLDDRGHML
jgi:hypothetical protein